MQHAGRPASEPPFDRTDSIIPVPGLGAHPTECWETKNFKWPTDALAKDFPRSRILLYMYQSAWQGTLQVEQQMDNVAAGLLAAINAHRDKVSPRRRPFLPPSTCR